MKFKNYLTIIGCLFFVFAASSLSAQKVNVYFGKLSALKGAKKMSVEFDYSDMSVGKFDDETDYVAKKTKEKNKDEAGTGDEWARKWVADREERFHGKFVELFNEYGKDKDLSVTTEPGIGKLKVVVHTRHTEPGWNVGISRRPAYINVDIWFVDTESGKAKVKMKIMKVPGSGAMGFDFDTGYRLQECYAKAAKTVAKYLNKKM